MTWSPQQDRALKAISDWHSSSEDQVFYLGGYAGTGKTTLAKEIANSVSGTALFAAFTGKAALVLRNKGCLGASTIHSLIYKAFEDEILDEKTGEATGVRWKYGLNPYSEVCVASVVIVDECSMVDARLGKDLLSFGTKLLVLGDPAQLPPVRGEGFFTAVAPDFMLTEIHRQAADNPIIAMSMRVREGERLLAGGYGTSRVITGNPGQRAVLEADQILVGRNATRRTVNGKVRRIQGRDPARPEPGDRLICLRNDRDRRLLNGGLWSVDELGDSEDATFPMTVTSIDTPGDTASIRVPSGFFCGREEDIPYEEKRGRDAFTYGYGVTVHKAQGSQWNNVLLFDESGAFGENRKRHLYTGLTRAAQSVTVVLT